MTSSNIKVERKTNATAGNECLDTFIATETAQSTGKKK